MINIVCLKWGTKYGPEYVNNLYAGIARNTTREFKFWCFTDDASGIRKEVITKGLPYANRLDSWWNKIYLFNPDLPISADENIFYIDLDTLIVSNIDDLLKIKTGNRIVVLRDFFHGMVKSAGLVGSGLMCWEHRKQAHLWHEFIKDPEKVIKQSHPYGDQYFIEKNIKNYKFWQDLFPDRVVSFKVHCTKGIPIKSSIICYHGKPSIPESVVDTTVIGKLTIQPQPWVLDHWKSRERCKVRFAKIPAREIFGMVGRCGGGYNTLWEDWSEEGQQKRELIMKEFEEGINDICGHYSLLEKSILKEGIRNPVIITCGYPKRRSIKYLPPDLRLVPESQLLLLEGTTGGSRLHIAQKHNLVINCIINDWTGRFDTYPEIRNEDGARKYYKDQPDNIIFNKTNGSYIDQLLGSRSSYHLDDHWTEDELMPMRAPLWINILKKYGYTIDKLPKRVMDTLNNESRNIL